MLVTLICSPLTTMGSALVLRRDGRPEPIAAAQQREQPRLLPSLSRGEGVGLIALLRK
jgi:hypothetical protein